VETSLMIGKNLGSVIDYSTQNGSYTAGKFYNGNRADTWLTNGNYPEYATIDLGREVPVSGFNVWPSYALTNNVADPRAPTRIKFEGSLDNTGWTTLGEFDYDNSLFYAERVFEVTATKARYIRVTGVECTSAPEYSSGIGGPGNKLMSLGELDVFFRLED